MLLAQAFTFAASSHGLLVYESMTQDLKPLGVGGIHDGGFNSNAASTAV